MIIDCISDLHGHYPILEGGDLLIVAGDLTKRDTQEELDKFDEWLCLQPYKKKIFIAGNHDNILVTETPRIYRMGNKNGMIERFEYLCDSGTEFEGLKIWGSPWSLTFTGINPKCTAFTGTEEELAERYALIPRDIDILVTHGPPYGVFDTIRRYPQDIPVRTGSEYLMNKFRGNTTLKIHVFGHIHEHGGTSGFIGPTRFLNASHVNEMYEPVNKPIRIIL
jgi:Icc-related predicted phosphoesterase